MNASDLAALLARLGCPPDRCGEMAAQLEKRARQLASQKNRSHDEALAHLLSLMKQGWAAQDSLAREPSSSPAPPSTPAHPPAPPAHAAVRPWVTDRSQLVGDFRIFTVRADVKASPRTGQSHDFYVIDCRNWVNVVAVTQNRQVILVEQYRHGSDTVELEIPGGVIDPEDASPEAAAIRELREETGYEGDSAEIIGQCFPNPAIMSNVCFTVLIRNCTLRHPVEFDQSEDIVTRLHPAADLPQLIAAGKFQHSLVIAALSHFSLRGPALL